MAIEFNPNRINGSANQVGKKRHAETTSDNKATPGSTDTVNVSSSSLSANARVNVEPVNDARQARELAVQISEQFRANPQIAHAAHGNANTQVMQNLLDAG